MTMETKRFSGWKFMLALGRGILFLAGYVLMSTLVVQLYSFFYLVVGAVVYLIQNPGMAAWESDEMLLLAQEMQGSIGPTSIVLGAGATILVVLVYALIRKQRFADVCGFHKAPPDLWVLAFAAGVFLNALILALISICAPILPASWLEENAESVGAVSTGNVVIVFLAVYIAAPFVEEILFRGVFYTGVRDTSHMLAATLITSVLFAFFHGNPLQGIYTFLLALILCYVRQLPDSLWPAVLLHIGFNSSSLFLSVLYTEIPAWVLAVISGGVSAILLVVYGIRCHFIRKKKREAFEKLTMEQSLTEATGLEGTDNG